MELNKKSSDSSLTEIQKISNESLLILKKTCSNSQNNYIEFDFVNPLIRETSQYSNFSQFLPVFNKDKKYYTPTFILKIDEVKYIEKDQYFQSVHEDKLHQDSEETSKFFQPKPCSANNFCLICYCEFDDYRQVRNHYIQHIEIKQHVMKLKKNKFRKEIKQICKAFKANDQKKLKSLKQLGSKSKIEQRKKICKSFKRRSC